MWQQFGEFQTSMHDGARRPSDWPGHVQSPRRSAVQSSPLHDEHDPNEDVHITGVQYILMDHPEISKVALETIRSLSKQWVKEEPAPDNETVDRDIGIGCLATASAESTGAEFAGSLNRDLLHDLLRSRQCRYQQLDPAQDAGATRRWSCFMKWYAIDEPRFRASHDKVSPRFTHGAHAHAGMYVADLVESFMRDEEKPEGLTPLVAAGWHGGLYVVFGNRRLWALQQYKDRHGPWTGRTPQIRVIVHEFPFSHIEPEKCVTLSSSKLWTRCLLSMAACGPCCNIGAGDLCPIRSGGSGDRPDGDPLLVTLTFLLILLK